MTKENKITNSFYSKFLKRCFDILFSFLLILVLLIPLALIYILTLCFLGYPVIYKQSRPGKNHKIFHIYKFRSMSNKKDENGNLLPDSMRTTKFGKFLRKTSLDELPQLFNILKGDMSFVGPRPRLIKDMVFYNKDAYDAYVVKPGLTGPTQTTGRNQNSWNQVFEKDIAYSQNISLINDLKIIFKTFTAVFKTSGETHSSNEENKNYDHEYYYADYLLRTEQISKEQYDNGLELAKQLCKSKKVVEFHPELTGKEKTEI